MDIAAPFNTSAQKHRKELLSLPSIGIEEAIKYMTPRPGVTYKESVAGLTGEPELRPYDGNTNGGENIGIEARTLETFLGSCVELFDPNALRKTLWAQLQTHNGKITDSAMNKAVLMKIMKSVLEKLNLGLFSAVRNDAGTTTAELFNGLDTITAAEITATNISAAKGNFLQLTSAIDDTNAVDVLKTIYRTSAPELKNQKTIMEVEYAIYEAYCDDYKQTTGAVPYNNQFEQVYLEGSNRRCEIVPMVSKSGSDYIHLTTKANQLYGYGAGVENESIEIRRGENPFKLQFILAMFFGVQFESISKKRLMVAKKFAG